MESSRCKIAQSMDPVRFLEFAPHTTNRRNTYFPARKGQISYHFRHDPVQGVLKPDVIHRPSVCSKPRRPWKTTSNQNRLSSRAVPNNSLVRYVPMPRTKSWQVITSPPVVRHTRSKPRAKSYSPEGTVAKESKSGGKRTG